MLLFFEMEETQELGFPEVQTLRRTWAHCLKLREHCGDGRVADLNRHLPLRCHCRGCLNVYAWKLREEDSLGVAVVGLEEEGMEAVEE